MEYRIVVDSCGELTDEMKKSGIYKTASLSMEVDGVHIQDDESFDQADFLKRVAESSECPKSSCPSPEKYMELYHCEAERVYAVTLSAELSGSHNSAELGRKLYEEEYGRKQIHVFNSRSASVGESLIALKIQECEEKGMEFEEVIASVDRYIEEQHTYFVLENLDTLRKNGRLTGLKSLAVSEYQAGHGGEPGRSDLSAWTGKRHEESSGEDGRTDRRRCDQSDGKDSCNFSLQLS